MVSYGYDHENAEKIIEYQNVQNFQKLFGTAVGAFAAYKVQPIYSEAAYRFPFFRKFWMRFPMQLSVFGVFYWIAI